MFLNFDKEEKWLSQMSEQGYHLQKVNAFGVYTFYKGSPEMRRYRIDYRIFTNKRDLDDYVQLFTDSGWNCVLSSINNGNHYFYTTQVSKEDIFSDRYSKAQRYSRYASQAAYFTFIFIIPYIVMYAGGTLKISNIGYLTPGLWEKTGQDFIFHFLFETPFVMLRALFYLLPLLMLLVFLYLIIRSLISYKRSMASSK